MKNLVALLIYQMCSIVCAAGAVSLAYHGVKGWGWFLFAAVLTTVTVAPAGKGADNQ